MKCNYYKKIIETLSSGPWNFFVKWIVDAYLVLGHTWRDGMWSNEEMSILRENVEKYCMVRRNT